MTTSVLVALSGGVDSSVAAALLLEAGHEVVAATMKLWGGESDSGCCSAADVDDARRVAQQLGIPHYVFAFGEDFERSVVGPYVDAHAAGRTPNPCIECNRSLKFDRFLRRADQLGFDAVATGHHARVVHEGGAWRLRRGADRGKDQSYVLHVLGQDQLRRTLLPVGELTKADVRARAAALGLRTAAKPESQEVCFVPAGAGGRARFLAGRLAATPGRVVDTTGAEVGSVAAVELVTVGQRRGLGVGGAGEPRYAVDVDVARATVTVGPAADLAVGAARLTGCTWVDGEPEGPVAAQCSAHGPPLPATWDRVASTVRFATPARRVAPGQSVALYDGDDCLGGGVVA